MHCRDLAGVMDVRVAKARFTVKGRGEPWKTNNNLGHIGTNSRVHLGAVSE